MSTKLTPAQQRVSANWPRNTFHAAKCKSYRESRVMFNAARALGLSASWSGQLFITRPRAETHSQRVVDASVDRILRRLNRNWGADKWTEGEKDERRAFVKKWCPIALPAFDLIRFGMYV